MGSSNHMLIGKIDPSYTPGDVKQIEMGRREEYGATAKLQALWEKDSIQQQLVGSLIQEYHLSRTCNSVQSQPAAVHSQLKISYTATYTELAEPALYCLAAHSLVTCTLFPGKWLCLYSGHKQLVTLNVYHIHKYWPKQRDFPSPVGRYAGRTRRGRRTKRFNSIAIVRMYAHTHL